MGFMQSYKRLDNLCRDMNGVGVTGYLEDMDRKSGAGLQVTGWWDDASWTGRTLLPCTVRPGENSSPLRQGERQSLPSRRPQNRTKRNIEAERCF